LISRTTSVTDDVHNVICLSQIGHQAGRYCNSHALPSVNTVLQSDTL